MHKDLVVSLDSGESPRALLLGHQLPLQGLALLSAAPTGKNLSVVLNAQVGQLLSPIAVFQDLASANQIDRLGRAVGSLCYLFSQDGYGPLLQFHL